MIFIEIIVLVFLIVIYTATMMHKYTPNSYLTSDQIDIYSNGEYWDVLWRRVPKK